MQQHNVAPQGDGGGWGPDGTEDRDPGAARGRLGPTAQTGVGRAEVDPNGPCSVVQVECTS